MTNSVVGALVGLGKIDAMFTSAETSVQRETAQYSQHDEQIHILGAVKTIERGRFFDIGAWHPKTFSNTRALFELGWEGVMIEGSPGPLKDLIAEYGDESRITLVSGFVGFPEQLARVHVTDDALSTTEDREYERWKSQKHFDGTLYIPIISISQIFDAFGSAFDFVNIDTEGTSVDIFRQLLSHREFWAKRFRPVCICVEFNDRLQEAVTLGKDAGYDVIHQNGENVIFKTGGPK